MGKGFDFPSWMGFRKGWRGAMGSQVSSPPHLCIVVLSEQWQCGPPHDLGLIWGQKIGADSLQRCTVQHSSWWSRLAKIRAANRTLLLIPQILYLHAAEDRGRFVSSPVVCASLFVNSQASRAVRFFIRRFKMNLIIILEFPFNSKWIFESSRPRCYLIKSRQHCTCRYFNNFDNRLKKNYKNIIGCINSIIIKYYMI